MQNNILEEGDIVFDNDKFYIVDIVGSEKAALSKWDFNIMEENPKYGISGREYAKSEDDIVVYKDISTYSPKNIPGYRNRFIVVGKSSTKGCSPINWDINTFLYNPYLKKYLEIISKNLSDYITKSNEIKKDIVKNIKENKVKKTIVKKHLPKNHKKVQK